VTKNGIVIVNADTIVQVLDARSSLPRGAQVIDLRRYTAIPGMIDAHTHITYAWDPQSGLDPWRQGPRPPETILKFQRANMLHTLETGVTTIRDLGASNYVDIALRDSVNEGVWVGPRMFVAGVGLSRRRVNDTSQTPVAAQIAAMVKRQVEAGADYIKMYGSTGSGADVTGTETFTFDEMKAAVDAAKQFGKRIAIHSYGPQGGRDAVPARQRSSIRSISTARRWPRWFVAGRSTCRRSITTGTTPNTRRTFATRRNRSRRWIPSGCSTSKRRAARSRPA
jgi:imidazolonepropionase-like amidohydrolase